MARTETRSAWAAGGTVFAASMMLMVGIWQVLVGIAALVEDEIFVTTPDYIYQLDLTSWGTIHVVVGAIVALTGAFVFMGRKWAYWTGVVVAALSATSQFVWLPWQPLWSMVMIAIDVFVIWALASAARATPMMGTGEDEYTSRTTGSWSNLNTQDERMRTNPAKGMDDAQTRDAKARMESESPAAGRTERPPEAM